MSVHPLSTPLAYDFLLSGKIFLGKLLSFSTLLSEKSDFGRANKRIVRVRITAQPTSSPKVNPFTIFANKRSKKGVVGCSMVTVVPLRTVPRGYHPHVLAGLCLLHFITNKLFHTKHTKSK